MTSGYYCAIFPFCGGGKKKKKKDKKTKAFYDWATTGIPVKNSPVHILLYAGNEILYKIKQLLSDYQNQLSRR